MKKEIVALEIITPVKGKTHELRAALKELIPHCLAEKGCLHYEILEPTDKDGKFLVLMRWQDKHSLVAHEASPTIQHFAKKYDGILYEYVTQTEWLPLT